MSQENLSFDSNKFSQPNNMMKARVEKHYATLPIAVTYTMNAGATSMALTATLPADNTLAFLRMTVTDANGVEAAAQFDVTNIAGGAAVNTTNLDAATDWLCQLHWAEPKASQDDPEFDSIEFTLEGAKGSVTDVFNTTNIAGTLSLATEGIVAGAVTVAKATTADAGTIALGNVAQNAACEVKIYFSNTATGNNPLQVLTIADNGADATISTAFGDQPFLPASIAPDTESVSYQVVNIDTSNLGGIAASSVTVVSDDTANPSYTVSITATIV